MEFLNLIREGKHQAILDYLRLKKELASYEEAALIGRGNHEEIMTYIAYHAFQQTAFNAFICRRKLNEIRFYLACDREIFDVESLIDEFGCAIIDEFVDYVCRHHDDLKPKVLEKYECLIIKVKEHCAIRRLICKVPLTVKGRKMLSRCGSKEDNLVYDLRWKE